jgi:hypothetical protein
MLDSSGFCTLQINFLVYIIEYLFLLDHVIYLANLELNLLYRRYFILSVVPCEQQYLDFRKNKLSITNYHVHNCFNT